MVALSDGAGEAMIPFTKAFLREFDPSAKTIRMELPEGLVALSTTVGAADGAENGAGED